MKTYLVDFENVKSKGLQGIEKLTEDDHVVIFYSENSDTISFEMHCSVMKAKSSVEYMKVNVGGKNALDFQLSTLLGYIVAKEHSTHIFIISNDKGFDKLHDFWENTFADAPKCSVYRTHNIAAAINYAKNRRPIMEEPIEVQKVEIEPEDITPAESHEVDVQPQQIKPQPQQRKPAETVHEAPAQKPQPQPQPVFRQVDFSLEDDAAYVRAQNKILEGSKEKPKPKDKEKESEKKSAKQPSEPAAKQEANKPAAKKPANQKKSAAEKRANRTAAAQNAPGKKRKSEQPDNKKQAKPEKAAKSNSAKADAAKKSGGTDDISFNLEERFSKRLHMRLDKICNDDDYLKVVTQIVNSDSDHRLCKNLVECFGDKKGNDIFRLIRSDYKNYRSGEPFEDEAKAEKPLVPKKVDLETKRNLHQLLDEKVSKDEFSGIIVQINRSASAEELEKNLVNRFGEDRGEEFFRLLKDPYNKFNERKPRKNKVRKNTPDVISISPESASEFVKRCFGDTLKGDEYAKVQKAIVDAGSKQEFYFSMMKIFGRKKGIDLYGGIKDDFTKLISESKVDK